MAVVQLFPQGKPGDEQRLAEFGLSSSDFHTAFSPGLSRAANRSKLAPLNAAGTDLYNDGFELLAQILVGRKWRHQPVMQQPRVIHPDGKLQLALSSAQGVGDSDHRVTPKTRHKGPATLLSLDRSVPSSQVPFDLPEFAQDEPLSPALAGAPFWFVLYQREGSRLALALGRPAGTDYSDRVVDWSDMIGIEPLDGAGDMSVFGSGDDGDHDIDVPVEPRD